MASVREWFRSWNRQRREDRLHTLRKDLDWARRFEAGFGGHASEIRQKKRGIARLERKLAE